MVSWNLPDATLECIYDYRAIYNWANFKVEILNTLI